MMFKCSRCQRTIPEEYVIPHPDTGESLCEACAVDVALEFYGAPVEKPEPKTKEN